MLVRTGFGCVSTRVEVFLGDFPVVFLSISQRFVSIDLLHIEAINREGSCCTLPMLHAVEVDGTLFATHPAAGDEGRREAHEPGVGVVLRRPSLATHRRSDIVNTSDAATRTAINDGTEHIEHLVGGCFRKDFAHFRCKTGDGVAVGILDARNVERRDANTFVRERRVGTDHLADRNVGCAKADGDDWVNTGNLIRLVEKLKTVDSDIVATNYTWINCETKLPEKRQEDPFRDLEYGHEYRFDEIADRTIIDMHAMAVKTELLREMNEKIDEHTFYVDVEYILFPIPYVKTVLFLEEDVYQYRLGMPGQSMSIKKMQKNLKNHLKVLFRINDYCEKMKDKATPAQMNYMNRIVAQTLVSQMKIYISFPLDRKMKKNIIKLDSYFYHHNRDAYDKVANGAVWLLRRTNYRLYPLAVLAFRNRRNSY